MAAEVPGSYHGSLFPKSSSNLMYSSFSLHWLSQIPEEVMKEGSLMWNKGRVSYPRSSNQVIEAFRAGFFSDMEAFIRARSTELAPGGLLVMLIPNRPDGTHPSESHNAHIIVCLSDTLEDMVKEKEGTDQAKGFISESIIETLELRKDLQVFTIADYGCSVGPNIFSSAETIIQAVQHKYKTQAPELKIPEFLVFFNDHVINDFNTLFRTPPPGRQYMAAGVPGSFQGSLFPKSSINLMHSALSLHWLSQVPQEVTEECSKTWNKGRISYPRSSNQVIEAFKARFFSDMEAFIKARSAELAPGGLLVMLLPVRADGSHPSESYGANIIECLGDTLADMVKEGLISEDLVDAFNFPVFFPSVSEVKEVIRSNSYLNIERVDEIHSGVDRSSPGYIQSCKMHVRAASEGILCKYFGQNLTDDIFDRYPENIEQFFKTSRSTHLGKTDKLDKVLLLVLRNGAS
ncbi:hypothetical protein ACH5RR_030056 [Cinchona calisaya]|uniref:Uncharacterized protein n=1 Tax=Cinchona calisaya TaxID=153742 RepID=A0ABD2YX99_9GENT